MCRPARRRRPAPLSALTTLLVIAGLVLKARQGLRLWAPVIGIVAGSAVAALFGLYDFGRIGRAAWIGIPAVEWPAPDLGFGPAFWTLLPGFLFIGLVCTIQTVSGAVAIQRVCWGGSRAVDFRAVQGAVAADGAGNLLSGFAGTMPLGFRPMGATMVEITGIGSRRIGIALGAATIALAFLPKALATILAIPGPVAAAFITVTMAAIFVIGMKMVVQDGLDYRKGLVAGVGFWIGAGFESGAVFPEMVSGFAGGFLQNGMIAGGVAAIAMTLFVELAKPRRSRLELAFDRSALQEIRAFVGAFAARNGWAGDMAERLDAASEETVLTLLDRDEAGEAGESRRRRRAPAAASDRPPGRRRRGPRIRGCEGRGEPAGPDRAARRSRRRRFDRAGSLAPAAAPSCILGPASAILRRRYFDRAGRSGPRPIRAGRRAGTVAITFSGRYPCILQYLPRTIRAFHSSAAISSQISSPTCATIRIIRT